MQALNSEQRRQTFVTFLLLYIITTLVVIMAVFFGTRVPLKQNEMMQGQLMQKERASIFRQDFSVRQNEIKMLLDTINKPNVQANLIDAQLDQKLSQLTAMVENDSSESKPFYQAVIKTLYDMKDDKSKLRASAGTASTSEEKDKTIADLKSKITEYSTALTNCQNQLIQLQR
ncbi:MAG: hypothetical protein JST52_07890 [Bacteroidetes bacterium]|nr:hypothetical protein [Bacteroidota bacterium]MBS1739926.1 hypothetical protein [Bacteroidota bacterium]MBS1777573.1 hypothetical protein [Bacteroidota bacterium]